MLRTWSDKLRRRPSDAPVTSTPTLATVRKSVSSRLSSETSSLPSEQRAQQQVRISSSVQVQIDSITEDNNNAVQKTTVQTPNLPATIVNVESIKPAAAKTPIQDLEEELLKESLDNNRRLKALIKSSLFRGVVPFELRFNVWKRLLGVKENEPGDEELSRQIRECPRDLPNQRVIRVDVERTRVDLSQFREPKTQEFVTQLLTYFCRTRKCRYKQGLNEVLAPFVYLQTQRPPEEAMANFCAEGSEAIVYKMWTAFMDRFAPHLYDFDEKSVDGEEMVSLQCSFRFFEMLLLYHDPEMWHVLDHNKLKPELYASAWLMTLLAQNVPMAQAFQLWEAMLLGEGPAGESLVVHFVALAFLCSNRNTFLLADPSDLPVLLTSKLSYHRRATSPGGRGYPSASSTSFSSQTDPESLVLLSETLRHALNTANELRKHTPDMLLWDMRRALHDKTRQPSTQLLRRLGTRLCATCSPEFFWLGITGKLEDSTEVIVVDCRPRREFEKKRARARLVFNLGSEVLENPEKLNSALADLRRHVLSDSTSPSSSTITTTATTGVRESHMPPSLSRAWRWHICVIGIKCQSIFDDPNLLVGGGSSRPNSTTTAGSPPSTTAYYPPRVNSSATISPPGSPDSQTTNKSGSDMADVDGVSGMCVLHLLKHSFPCVSVVEGGWDKVLAACPDPDTLLFPTTISLMASAAALASSSSTNKSRNIGAEEESFLPQGQARNQQVSSSASSSSSRHPAYRRPRASYGDAVMVEDFDGPSFIVSRSSRGAPVKF